MLKNTGKINFDFLNINVPENNHKKQKNYKNIKFHIKQFLI